MDKFKLDVREILALVCVSAFTIAAFAVAKFEGVNVDALENVAYIVIGFYFGNKSTLDKPEV